MKIRLSDAIGMVRKIEDALAPVGYHVGLRGSVLIEGESENDLDIIVYPRDSTRLNKVWRVVAMHELGMRGVRTVKQSHEHWRKRGSTDEKLIEIWDWNGVVVDVLLTVDEPCSWNEPI